MRLIDADKFISQIDDQYMEHDITRSQYLDLADRIMQQPTIEPEREKGKWIMDENPHDGDCRCSNCFVAIDQMHERNHPVLNALTNGKWWTFYKFCPNCGADMRNN